MCQGWGWGRASKFDKQDIQNACPGPFGLGVNLIWPGNSKMDALCQNFTINIQYDDFRGNEFIITLKLSTYYKVTLFDLSIRVCVASTNLCVYISILQVTLFSKL